MPALVVGGVTIPVAPNGVKRDRLDMFDRARVFDGTYFASQTGNPKRDWFFTTPPVLRADADFYELVLAQVGAVVCSGDVIGGSYNQLHWSEDFTNAEWVKSGAMTVTPGVADPLGGTTATTLTASGATQNIIQTLSAINSNVRTNSLWFRRRTGTSIIRLYAADDVTFLEVASSGLSSVWQRFAVTSPSTTLRKFDVVIGVSGDAIDIWGGQLQEGSVATSYQKTEAINVEGNLVSCVPEITGWTPVRVQGGHRVVLDFALHER